MTNTSSEPLYFLHETIVNFPFKYQDKKIILLILFQYRICVRGPMPCCFLFRPIHFLLKDGKDVKYQGGFGWKSICCSPALVFCSENFPLSYFSLFFTVLSDWTIVFPARKKGLNRRNEIWKIEWSCTDDSNNFFVVSKLLLK